MTEDLESLLVELLLEEDPEQSVQEKFLGFLVMEPFIRQFRSQGLSNKDVLDLCRKLDERNRDGTS